MFVDGLRGLSTGTYFSTGGTEVLGPWAAIVSALGIVPVSPLMETIFVAFGVVYAAAIVLYVANPTKGSTALAVTAVATLWYLPLGTLLSALQLLCLWLQRRR